MDGAVMCVVVDEYVVETDQDAVLRARAVTIRAKTVSAVVYLVGAGLITCAAVGLTAVAGATNWLGFVPAVMLCFAGAQNLRAARSLRAVWTEYGVVPVAMRLSPAGLRMSIDAAPDSVFLPWETVRGFHRHRRRGRQLLVLDLMPGVMATTPGVTGLGHPDVQRVLHHKVFGVKGLRVAVEVLRQPVAAIDQKLAAFTGGRVRVH
jgi:hypothetical protein